VLVEIESDPSGPSQPRHNPCSSHLEHSKILDERRYAQRLTSAIRCSGHATFQAVVMDSQCARDAIHAVSPTSITFPQTRQLHLPIPKGVKSVVDDVFLTLAVVGSARKGGMGGKLRRGRRSWFPPVGAKPPEILSVRSTLRFLVPSVFTFRLLPSFWSRGWISGYSVWPRLLGSFRMSARG